MKIDGNQLKQHLRQPLSPVYLVSGDDPLLVQEACDSIRQVAGKHGFSEREVFFVEADFDWGELLRSAYSPSLFAQQRLLELRLTSAKPGDKGIKTLLQYAANPPDDCLLLIISGRLEAASKRAKWLAVLQKTGTLVQIWPPDSQQFPGWLAQRAQQLGLSISREAIGLIAYHTEGNLLAATQELQRLQLLYEQQNITLAQVKQMIIDYGRFNIFGLVDRVLQGDVAAIVRMLVGLKAEGMEPILVLWALNREIHTLATMSAALTHGASMAQLIQQHRIWGKKKPLVAAALKRHKHANWLQFIQNAAAIDRVIKGLKPGDCWDDLLELGLAMAR